MIKGIIFLTLLVLSQTYDSDENVLKLSDSDFDQALKDFEYLLVKFFAPGQGDCDSFAPDYKQAALSFFDQKSRVKLAQVDCTISKDLCSRYNIQDYPTINYYSNGAEPVKYSSQKKKDSIVNWVKDKLPDSQSGEGVYQKEGYEYILTDETYPKAIKEFDYLLVKFYAPWCGHCQKVAPIFASAASKLSVITSKAILASVDCTVYKEVCQSNDIKGYPTLKMFVKGSEPIQYTMGRTEQAIIDFVKNQISTVKSFISDDQKQL